MRAGGCRPAAGENIEDEHLVQVKDSAARAVRCGGNRSLGIGFRSLAPHTRLDAPRALEAKIR